MKKTFLNLLIVFASTQIMAQVDNSTIKGYHRHDGFYLSLNFGSQIADLAVKSNGQSEIGLSGLGLIGDYKIGWAVKENMILHLTLLGNSINDPSIIGLTNASVGSIPEISKVGISTAGIGMLIGGGITKYIMPLNLFLSASVGTGQFMISDNIGSSFTTNVGTSFQLKAGKEWWVSANWGLGLSLSYIRTNANMQYGNNSTERLASDFFGIMFNTTFN